ncbi:MAG TPA: hypothetical protein VHQ23_15770 [Ilumatobacteraceae bacterium]|nr:hypothetical protein [Ilumatobacteraceae bacterium]
MTRVGTDGSMARRWNIVALVTAAITGFSAVLLPLGTSTSVSSEGVTTTSHVSLLSNEGPSVLVIVTIPLLLVALPLLLRNPKASHRARVVVVVLLGILVLLGALSIGLFFVPTLIAMIVSLTSESKVPHGYPSRDP